MYLSGRSKLEKKVYFTKVLNNRADITIYDNYQECIFAILPKLSHTALKNYKREINLMEKLEINRKRVDNENLLNENIIKRHQGIAVQIGQEIIL